MEPRKLGVREAFSRAAPSYDLHADVQRQAGQNLGAHFQVISPDLILELGCATGGYTLSLVEAFPTATILALDFSAALLAIAAKKLAAFPRVRLLCSDAEEFLCASTQTFDLITANATLQWLSDLPKALARMARRTADNGVLLASIFGPRTFYELGAALAAVHNDHSVLPAALFPRKDALYAMLTTCYAGVELEEMTMQRTYPSTLELLRHIKKTGASGGGRLVPVLTPSSLRRMDDWFQNEFGGCTVTYQIFLLRARRRGPIAGQ